MTKNIVWSVICILLIIFNDGISILVFVGGFFLIVNIVQFIRKKSRITQKELLTQGKCPNCGMPVDSDSTFCKHCMYAENCIWCERGTPEDMLHCEHCQGKGLRKRYLWDGTGKVRKI